MPAVPLTNGVDTVIVTQGSSPQQWDNAYDGLAGIDVIDLTSHGYRASTFANFYSLSADATGLITLTSVSGGNRTMTFENFETLKIGTSVFNLGTNGDDTIIGGALDDGWLTGRDGNDTLDGGPGADTMHGGTGDDVYIVDNVFDRVVEGAGAGSDTVQSSVAITALAAEVENLTLTGTAASGVGNSLANVITGNASANTLTGGVGDDTLIGGGGNDSVVLAGARANYTITLLSAGSYRVVDATVGRDGSDTLRDITTIMFADGTFALADLVPEPPAITIDGTLDADHLTGTDAREIINGLGGNDTLAGGAGPDTLTGGAGDDAIDGGDGADVAVFSGARADYTITSFGPGGIIVTDRTAGRDGIDTVIGVETIRFADGSFAIPQLLDQTIYGTALADTLTGTTGNDVMRALAGADTLDGGGGADQMYGGTGNDLYIVNAIGDRALELANAGIDRVSASVSFTLGSHVEHLTLIGAGAISGTGNGMANQITGNGAANRITGGLGKDTLTGGGGKDVFIFATIGDSKAGQVTRDTIMDFRHLFDRIDLSGLDANTRTAGNAAFKFIGKAGFSDRAGELRYSTSGTATLISGDVNGDGTADFQIFLSGVKTLTVEDFIL